MATPEQLETWLSQLQAMRLRQGALGVQLQAAQQEVAAEGRRRPAATQVRRTLVNT